MESFWTVQGELLDVSPHGFRIKHNHPELVAGKQFQVLYSWGRVPGRVVWSKKQGLGYESGIELG